MNRTKPIQDETAVVYCVKATITRYDLSRFFCIDATLLCEFESDKYESTSLNRIVADKSDRVIVA